MTELDENTLDEMVKQATNARDNAYCPYSNHPVGVALLSKDKKIYTGCNVETANYRSLCAEDSAVSAMITNGDKDIQAVVVIGPTMEYLCTPCGACRQKLREFITLLNEVPIYSMWKDGSFGKKSTIADLLPDSFGPENMVEVGTLK